MYIDTDRQNAKNDKFKLMTDGNREREKKRNGMEWNERAKPSKSLSF